MGVAAKYTYDAGGNITSRDEYAYTTGDVSGEPTSHKTYGYGNASWKDMLTEYNGQRITYDGMGNPLNYRDGMFFAWNNGRRMSSSVAGSIRTTYDYDIDGNRVERNGAGYRRKYNVIDGVTIGEQITFNGATHYMEYMRDENGDVYGFIYDGSTYFLEKNALGDVQYLLDGSGNVLVKYSYDEWGKKIAVTDTNGNAITDGTNIAHLNPFRYRSYCYDDETGLYYLGSRYYDPQTGKFVNMDNVTDGNAGVIGYNLFIYAANNPINNSDPTGNGIIKSAIKWVAKNIVKPVVNTVRKINASMGDFTQTHGINIGGMFMGGGSVSGGITFDTKGNLGLIGTTCYGGGTPSASITRFTTVSNAPNIFEQKGQSVQIGGSGSVGPVSLGGEYSAFKSDSLDKICQGVTYTAGVGTPIPFELHGEIANSVVIGFNIYDTIDKLYIKIMEW